MRTLHIKLILLAATIVGFGSCQKTAEEKQEPVQERVALKLSGSVGLPTKGDGAIDPQGTEATGLPPHQLSIGVIALLHAPEGNPADENNWPDLTEWSVLNDFHRAYFGGIAGGGLI